MVTGVRARVSACALAGVVLGGLLVFLFGQGVAAVVRSPLNDAERDAKALCTTTSRERRGAIWFTNSSSYYSDTVEVDGTYTGDAVDVFIRGSVYSCGQAGEVSTGAIEVAPSPATSGGQEYKRLTGLDTSELARGTVKGTNNWSTQGSQIKATLNIKGLATNNIGKNDSQTITIGIYRCFYNYTIKAKGVCYTQDIDVKVVRKSQPQKWTLAGSSQVKAGSGAASASVVAAPSTVLTWTHQLKNNGPHNTDKKVTSSLGVSGFSNKWASGMSSEVIASGAGVGTMRSAWGNTKYTVTQDDVGSVLCQWVQADPWDWEGARNYEGTKACASVPYNYSLTPTLTISRDEGGFGDPLTVAGEVANTKKTKSKATQWRFSYVVVDPGKTIPDGGTTVVTTNPCDQYKGSGVKCDTASFSSGGDASGDGLVIAADGYKFAVRSSSVQDLKVGTKVCYGLSVKDRASNSTEWRHSALDCMVVSKRPVVQVLGSDLIVGRNSVSEVKTSVKSVDGRTYGAYGEYGLVVTGPVVGMASASGYAGGPASVAGLCAVSHLTFSNRPQGGGACATGALGYYNFGGVTPAIASRFPINSATPAIEGARNISTQLSPRTIYRSATGVQLSASADIALGNWYVINAPTSTVVITSDIQYTNNPISSAAEIPQVVIIAQNIIIKDTVTRVDAWLVATGTGTEGRINTCGAGTGIDQNTLPHAGQCTQPLRVNGPVMANHLIMRRTAGAGSGTASGSPAEVFNLRPDAYLWASAILDESTRARTMLTVELPPRL